jgi:TIR domain
MSWDVFISHASEDKDAVARPLADLLSGCGLSIWLDEQELRLGDRLRDKIDEGLAESRFGVVVLSRSFFAKDWPKRELDGLFARETTHNKVILPIWHEVDQEFISRYSPLVAGRIAASTERGIGTVASEILNVVIPLRAAENQVPLEHYYSEDRNLLEDLLPVFNRPAFRGTFLWQTDPDPSYRAMKLTLKAINTGDVQDNKGITKRFIKPITDIKDRKLFDRTQQIETQLKTVCNLIEILKTKSRDEGQSIRAEIDAKRDAIIGGLNAIWSCFGLHTLPIPTEVTDATDVWERFS